MQLWGFVFLLLVLPFISAGLSLAPWVPTRKRDIERLIDQLQLLPGEQFLEVGSADARVSCALALAFPETCFTGIELAFPIFCLGYLRKTYGRNKNLTLRFGSALTEDFGKYDAIYIFGMPDKLAVKIVPKFMLEAKTGARLISYVFSLPETQDLEIQSYGNPQEAKIHIGTKL